MKIRKLTKKQEGLIENYNRTWEEYPWGRTLENCYESFSRAKKDAERKIWQDMEEVEGNSYTVTSYNSMNFSAGFQYKKDGIKMLRYYTKCNTYDIPMVEEV